MNEYDIQHKTELELEIISLIKSLEEDPQRLENFAKLVKVAHAYVQVDSDITTPEKSRFMAHQLCSKCQTIRSNYDEDAKKEKVLRFRLQTCMLRALSFKLNRTISTWLRGLYLTINDCVDCYKGFLRVKREIGPSFLHTFEQARIEQFLTFAQEWEEKGALEFLSERNTSKNTSKDTIRPTELYAMLELAGTIVARGGKSELYETLKTNRSQLRLAQLSEAPSGLLAFSIDTDQDVRSWLETQATVLPMSSEMSSSKTAKKLLRLGIERKEWNGVAVLLGLAPELIKGSALPSIILGHLSTESDDPSSVFQFFHRMLDMKGSHLWEAEDAEYPLNVLTTILDNSNYRACILRPGASRLLLAWTQPLLASLLSLRKKETTIEIEEAEPQVESKVFENAFKQVIHFLLETIQQGNVEVSRRESAFDQAVSLLQHFLTLGDQYDANIAANAAKTSAEIATLHASLLAGFTLRGKLPNTMEVIANGSDSRKAALNLIQHIFEMDCSNMSDSLHLLSKVTIDHQAMYKTLLRRYSSKRDTGTVSNMQDPSFNNLFKDSGKSLEITPWIPSDLWRESYNAFRPLDDVTLFLKPLATLSTFVQPQISSHIIAAKAEHAESPAFLFYKERLRSCLVSLTRRLRSMRGNLPQVLLDVSDDTGVNSRASQTLMTISYKLADCVIQANLCPEPDIYKAAQNLVRSTFEEAETRGDCFRVLLQCNPALALEGIERYLESFVIAASTLVEANDAAKWMVRSFSDILDVLCSQTDGLLREGTPHSLVDNTTARPHVRRLLPAIWQLMCRSIAIIFKRTPSWSRVLDHKELTAWFRDVLLFASDLAEQVGIVQAAAAYGGQADEEIQENILLDVAIPLEEAYSWFRMNDQEIVQETRDYFVKGLLCFKGQVELPHSTKQRMLDFIDGQSKIEDRESRTTLLSLRELLELRHLLEPQEVIEIQDSDEDTATITGIKTPPRQIESTREAVEEKAERATSKVLVNDAQSSRAESSEQRQLKQKKLSFEKVDSSTSRPFLSKATPLPPRPQFASTHTPANRYSGASAKLSTSVKSSTSSAFAEARRNFNASSVWKNQQNLSRPTYSSVSRELRDPQAPAAKRSFTGAPLDQMNGHTARPEPPSQGSESSESDSDEDKELMGLADLMGQKKSPIKMRTKTKVIAPARRTILKEDLEERRRQREREEVERKRKLRERVNLRPLHRTILSWNIYADGPRPPVQTNSSPPRYDYVKSIYKSPQEYVDIFEPMLWLEAWAELQNAKAELAKGGNTSSTIQVTGRTAIDSFVVLTVTLQVQHNQNQKPITFNDADIVYLREAGSTTAQPKCILAKVDAYKFDAARKTDRLTLRCCLQYDTQAMTSLLTNGATLEMGKLFTLITLHREYEALHVVQYYNLIPSILLAKTSIRETVLDSEIRQAEVNYGINRPQAEAILSSLKAEQGFNLIQGPPGTGKTKTICSLVAHFIQTRKDVAVPIRAGQAGTGAGIVKKKILLCAPSNAAVDEVARRVFEGVQLKNGKFIRPSVVRLGREETMNISVKRFSLESIVERKLASTETSSQPDAATDDVAKMQYEIRRLADERNTKRAELENAQFNKKNEKIISQLDTEVRTISMRRMDLMGRLDEVRDKRQTVHRQHNADRKRIEQDVLAEADVVCATLGGAGHNLLCDLPFDFETVVIDEAAQAVEMDTLIPLRYGCQRCILVGDPSQLPPTVISQEAEKLRYSKSLFVRLFNNPNNYSNLLSIQYRMHPTISKFPSTEFYEGKLTDGPEMAALTAKQWHNDSLLGPFRFFDCVNSREASGRGTSLINREEALMAAAIYERLRKQALRFGGQSMDGRVGVISMYKEQIFELKRAFEGIYGKGIDDVVDFNTVDGFQGQEKDAIILSCVRSNGLGFLTDFRRVNVAITRAKSNLFIVGNASNLERAGQGTIWPRLISMARTQNCFMSVTREMFQRPAIVSAPESVPIRASNGAAGPSQPSNKAASPVKRKASTTSSPQDVTAKTASKRLHLERPSPSKIGPLPRPSSTPTGPRNGSSGSSSMRPRPPNNASSFAHYPVSQPHRPANMSKPPSRAPVRPVQPPQPAIKRAVPVLPPGQVANAPRPPPRPVQLNQPAHTRPRFSSQEGPSERAKSSLFMPKSNRLTKNKKN